MAWTPSSQETLYRSFPETPSLSHLDQELYREFTDRWEDEGGAVPIRSGNERYLIILVRGIFGSYMPGHFKRVTEALRAMGHEVVIAPTKTAGTVEENCERLRAFIRSFDLSRPRLIYAHSKGGIEALHVLNRDEEIRKSTHGLLLCQTPRGASAVLESILENRYDKGTQTQFKELALRIGIKLIAAKGGCRDLIDVSESSPIRKVQDCSFGFPVLQVSSWSLTPTTWLDSYHQRLGEIRPKVAHDGQFYTEDLIWPQFKNLCVGSIDHAQPVVGGEGFDEGKFWTILHSLMLDLIREEV
jgi:hypothetical protein